MRYPGIGFRVAALAAIVVSSGCASTGTMSGTNGDEQAEARELADLLIRLATEAGSTIDDGYTVSRLMADRIPAGDWQKLTVRLPAPPPQPACGW